MKKITTDSIINLILFMYIFSLYLFTYREGLFLISNGLALLFVFLVIIRILYSKSRIIINKYLRYHLLFILICTFSYFYAIEPSYVISDVRTLILIYIVMVAIVNYVDTPKKVSWVINSFIISGLASSIYIILVSDFTNATRFGSELGNVNDMGMILGISATFSINEFFRTNKKLHLLYLIPMLLIIILTGSRQSLFFIIFTMLFIIYSRNKQELTGKIKFMILGTIILLGSAYAVTEIPILYDIMGRRLEGLIALVSGSGKVDNSALTRRHMIDFGIELFKQKPILGYGAKNYRSMYGLAYGIDRYAHNNFIDLLVNLGLVGTGIYYYSNYIVYKSLLKYQKKHKNSALIYPFMAIIIGYFLIGMTNVYYYDKHYSYLLALACVIPGVLHKYDYDEDH